MAAGSAAAAAVDTHIVATSLGAAAAVAGRQALTYCIDWGRSPLARDSCHMAVG